MVTGCLEKKNNSSLELSFVAFTANLEPDDPQMGQCKYSRQLSSN